MKEGYNNFSQLSLNHHAMKINITRMIIVGLVLLLSHMPFWAENVWEMYGETWAPEVKNTHIFHESDPKNGPKMPFLRPIFTKRVILTNKHAFELHWAPLRPPSLVPVRYHVP